MKTQYADTITEIQASRNLNGKQFAAELEVSEAFACLLKQGGRVPGQGTFTALLNLATTAEQQAALLRARYADANFEILAYADDGLGGIKLVRIPASDDNEKGD